MAKLYKGYEKGKSWAEEYIKENNIKCRYYGWAGMAGDIDLIKIDGRIRRFNIETKKEVRL